MRNFQILIVSAVKICKQCVTKVLRLLGDFSLTDFFPMRPHKKGEGKGKKEGKEREGMEDEGMGWKGRERGEEEGNGREERGAEKEGAPPGSGPRIMSLEPR